MAGWDPERYPEKNGHWFERQIGKAMAEGRRVLAPNGIGTVVFAHKSTSGWEAVLQALIDAGWTVTASWPIDTEMGSRLRAINSAVLASSIHLVCRPRENPDGSLRATEVGDWREVLAELPKRMHEWMPRLSEEGIVGADAIFACLGPALEVFSRYSRVEKASGEQVSLRDYLEQVWAAVSQEALHMVFEGADASGFEEDARLTAMWLWTLSTGNGQSAAGDATDEGGGDADDEDGGGGRAVGGGYTLEYDAARKIAQGLGAHLEALASVVEIKGETARLLPVTERTKALFGKDEADAPVGRKKKTKQMMLAFAEELQQAEAIDGEKDELHIDECQRRQLGEFVKRTARDVKESVWRSYKCLLLLGKDNEMRKVDLGLVNSSQAATLVEVILKRLREDGDIEKSISPNFLARKWPGFKEWSTKAVRDAFFASPEFPRLLNADGVKETIARGVSQNILAYVGKRPDGHYDPFIFEREMSLQEVEISDDVFILTAEEAKKHIEPPKLTAVTITPQEARVKPGAHVTFQARGADQHGRPIALPSVSWSAKGGAIDDKGAYKADKEEGEFLVEATAGGLTAQARVTVTKEDAPPPPPPPKPEAKTMRWTGDVPAQKWMNFYTKVLAKFATSGKLKLNVSFEITPDGGLPPHRVDETKATLRELGLDDEVQAGG